MNQIELRKRPGFSRLARRARSALLVCAVAWIAVAAGSANGAEDPVQTLRNASGAGESRELHAGPVRLKLADGEIRYLYVGPKEIIRRVYFGVRDDQWQTALPRFTEYRVEDQQDHFTVHVAAVCQRGAVDYRWTGTITGSPDGTIEFEAGGAPMVDFASNRIGLCVLYGMPSLIEQQFETESVQGGTVKGQFPRLVSPTLVAKQYRKLTYTADKGLTVSTTLQGAIFDMEDQRNWGDTSWKAYAPLPYAYKQLKKGQELREKVTIRISGVPEILRSESTSKPTLRLGDASPTARLPRILPAGQMKGPAGFSNVNMNRPKYKGQPELTWGYTPAEHQPDRDTKTENLAGVMYQGQTAHSFAPQAKLRVGPINFGGDRWPNSAEEESSPFAAAWAASFMQYAALGDVSEVAFGFKPGPADAVIKDFQSHAGQPIRVAMASPDTLPITAFAVGSAESLVLWVANHSDHNSTATITGLGNLREARITQLTTAAARAPERRISLSGGELEIELAPYEVVRVNAEQ